MTIVLTKRNREQLLRHAEALNGSMSQSVRECPSPSLDSIIATREIRGYLDCLTPEFQETQNDITKCFGSDSCDAFNRLILIGLLLEFEPDPYLPKLPPAWLYDSYAERANFIAESLIAAPQGEYAALSESFVKDLRILGGISYPNYRLVVDWHAYLPTTFYRYQGLRENLRNFIFVRVTAGGLGPYLRDHYDVRFTDLRRQFGGDASRHRNAEILQSCPSILGQVGTGWVNDPALKRVSPHLWERTGVPHENGAFVRRDGFNELDVERATSTSETRRRLYEEGKYRPCAHTVVWPRKQVIAWHLRATQDGADPKNTATNL